MTYVGGKTVSVRRKIKFSVLILVVLICMGLATNDFTGGNTRIIRQVLMPSDPQVRTSGAAIPSADPDWPFDFWINAGSYYYFYAYRLEDTALYGSFDVLTSSGIDFFICDQSNFDLWTGGHTASVYQKHPSVGSADWAFIVPHSDTWYMMYDNTDTLFYQAHVTGTHRIDTTAPTVNLNLDDGSTYSGTVTITASASDEGFGVYSLILYIDGVLTDTEYASSLSYSWDTTRFQDSEHTIRIRAEDGAGHITDVEIDVNVSNLPGLLIPIVAAGIGIPVIIGLAIFLSRKMRHPVQGQMVSSFEGPGIGSQYPAQDYIERQPMRQLLAFCPSCGMARTPPNARFCGNCGASFPD
jgi:hypothetical protein